ncbi:pantoate--beta-alanine ligase [Catenovulum maritimum]|uniref:Pantothenate synthetase n=1 Tax=Catenovulum maritimum TaxID=1513271 RepID=A0A0J8GYC5_9ALTE|nr:pantoate--beta-alanine ligase [Catenovulum maritimum]KMT66239.1 pantoate--beta-alanine ligase [Catenovulum maritimum]
MQTVQTVETLRSQVKTFKQAGKSIAFVPTMGNLHTGHLELVKVAKTKADVVIASIFVNPMQFGANEDLDSYPRTLEEDSQALAELGVNLLFTPTPEIMYPKGLAVQTFVEVPNVSALYCGQSRPVHFRGVTTIVNKLFNLVQPDVACFGEKDFQQLSLIKTMVEDLSLPIEIIGVPTKRESSGLAKSSRNGYLTEVQKQQATVLYQSLTLAKAEVDQGNLNFAALKAQIQQKIETAGLVVDYVEFADAKSLQPATEDSESVVLLLAAYLGKTRLIDNQVLFTKKP